MAPIAGPHLRLQRLWVGALELRPPREFGHLVWSAQQAPRGNENGLGAVVAEAADEWVTRSAGVALKYSVHDLRA